MYLHWIFRTILYRIEQIIQHRHDEALFIEFESIVVWFDMLCNAVCISHLSYPSSHKIRSYNWIFNSTSERCIRFFFSSRKFQINIISSEPYAWLPWLHLFQRIFSLSCSRWRMILQLRAVDKCQERSYFPICTNIYSELNWI